MKKVQRKKSLVGKVQQNICRVNNIFVWERAEKLWRDLAAGQVNGGQAAGRVEALYVTYVKVTWYRQTVRHS
jgi:hypothetical protein